jgi:O-antigen/teichoic acid export membrane protein
MLWILLPLVGALALSGGIILMIYGPAFHQGAAWLGIVGIACATTAFVSLGETVIMVQRPRLNLLNSSITCVVAVGANLWLIPRFGVMGAAFGILIPYVVQGVLRYFVLRLVFGWQNPWRSINPPVLTAIVAFIPALPCRLFLPGMAAQLTAGLVFLAIFGVGWLHHRRSNNLA